MPKSWWRFMSAVGWRCSGPFVLRAGHLVLGSWCPLPSTVSARLQSLARSWRNHGFAMQLARRGMVQLQRLPGKRWGETKGVLETSPSPSGGPRCYPIATHRHVRPSAAFSWPPPLRTTLRTGLGPPVLCKRGKRRASFSWIPKATGVVWLPQADQQGALEVSLPVSHHCVPEALKAGHSFTKCTF